jgi:hypothetical protein
LITCAPRPQTTPASARRAGDGANDRLEIGGGEDVRRDSISAATDPPGSVGRAKSSARFARARFQRIRLDVGGIEVIIRKGHSWRLGELATW